MTEGVSCSSTLNLLILRMIVALQTKYFCVAWKQHSYCILPRLLMMTGMKPLPDTALPGLMRWNSRFFHMWGSLQACLLWC